MQDKIEIFRPGTHRAENGQSYTFTEADVAAIAGAYDPAVFASPLVLGHPKTDDPAWGWVAGLSINAAGVLVATHEKVAAEFAEGVDAGRYRKVSAAFYAPEDPANPTPGAWYLRHVGYLCAQAPAVKGLQAAFAADAAEGVAFADAAYPTSWGLSTAAQAVRSIRDWILAKFGQEEADKALPAWFDQSLQASASEVADAASGDQAVSPGFAEPLSSPETTDPAARVNQPAGSDGAAALAAREAAVAARETQVQARAAQFAEAGRQEARGQDLAFVTGLVDDGKLPPGHKDRLLALFAQADGDTSVAFAEPNTNIRTELKALLSDLGQTIHFSEFAASDGFTGEVNPGELATRAGRLVDEARARGETLSYADAVTRAGKP